MNLKVNTANTSLKEIRKEVRHLVDIHSLDCEQAISEPIFLTRGMEFG
ncbi:MAG: hypothetical protein RLZZ74_1632 [Cyanobacteriota bacterium]|jgi:hypothetical protein